MAATISEEDRKLDEKRRLMRSSEYFRHLAAQLAKVQPVRSTDDSDRRRPNKDDLEVDPDVTIVIGSNKFACHRLVLALNSEFFRSRLRRSSIITGGEESDITSAGQLHCNDDVIVKVSADELDAKVFEKVIDFLYSGTVELCLSDVADIYCAARTLGIGTLSAVCIDYMIATLSIENCFKYWTFAETARTTVESDIVARSSTLSLTSQNNDSDDDVEDDISMTSASKATGSNVDVLKAGAAAAGRQQPASGLGIAEDTGRLADACCYLVQTEFYQLTYRSDFGDLTPTMIKSILNGLALRVKSETDICEMLVRWLESQYCRSSRSGTMYPNEESTSPQVLWSLIRWSGVHVDYVRSVLLANDTVRSDPGSVTLLRRVVGFLESGIQFYGLRTFHRAWTGLERCFMLFGVGDGQSGCQQVIYRINLQHVQQQQQQQSSATSSDRSAAAQPTSVPGGGSGSQSQTSSGCSTSVSDRRLTCIERGPSSSLTSWPVLQREAAACCPPPGIAGPAATVYLTGLGRQCNEVWTWSLAAGWTRCGDMAIGRGRHAVCHVGGRTYSLGGVHRGATIDSIELYDPVSNQSRLVSGKLVNPLKNFACVSHRTAIYVFGGLDSKERASAEVQVYETARDVCTTLVGRSMPRPIGHCRAVMYDQTALVFSRSTCLVYNIDDQKWTEKRRLGAGARQFGLAVDNGRIYVAGGGVSETGQFGTTRFNLIGDVKSLPVSAAISGVQVPVWTHHFRLPKPGICSAFAVVTLPSVS